jgi:peptidoglycan/xylan/chitin deacetylase (PgdA/CDA1 family)
MAELEIVKTHELIEEVVREAGVGAKNQNLFFRFPHGDEGSRSNRIAILRVLADLDYRIAGWSLDTDDWRMCLEWLPSDPDRIVTNMRRALPRDIVLLHDRRKTARIVPCLAAVLKSMRLESRGLSDFDSAHRNIALKDAAGLLPFYVDNEFALNAVPRRIGDTTTNIKFERLVSLGKVLSADIKACLW